MVRFKISVAFFLASIAAHVVALPLPAGPGVTDKHMQASQWIYFSFLSVFIWHLTVIYRSGPHPGSSSPPSSSPPPAPVSICSNNNFLLIDILNYSSRTTIIILSEIFPSLLFFIWHLIVVYRSGHPHPVTGGSSPSVSICLTTIFDFMISLTIRTKGSSQVTRWINFHSCQFLYGIWL